MSIRIITDTASDVYALGLENVEVLPMTVTFGEVQYLDEVELPHKKFYEMLIESDELPVTSQISPFQFETAFKKAVDEGDTVICITIASKLSGTYQSACIASENYPGKVFVVDSESATIGEGILVQMASQLVAEGKSADEIVDTLNREKKNILIIALLDTLEYLKRGGRLSKTTATIGGILSIKPVISLADGELNVLGKARGSKTATIFLRRRLKRLTALISASLICSATRV